MKNKSTLDTVLAALFCLGASFSASAQNDSILAANSVAQNFGTPNTRTVYDTVVMPHSLSAYARSFSCGIFTIII